MTRSANAERMRTAGVRPLAAAAGMALLGLLLAVSAPAAAQGRRGGGRGEAPRYERPSQRPGAPRNQGRPARPDQSRPNRAQQQQRGFQNQNRGYRKQAPMGGYGRGQTYGRPGQGYAGPGANYGRQGQARPNYPGAAPNEGRPGQSYGRQGQYDGRQGQPNPGYARPGNRPYSYPASPPGHLGSWLNKHRNMPLQGQEQLLRNDPSFRQLPPADQQRLMRQLQQVDRMPEQERERRLARAEMIERMSPQERMQLNQSSRQLRALPPDRQALVKRAFQELRSVPLDQRQTVLDSERYQGMFSPQERNILGTLLRAEPYEPPR